MKIEDMKIGDYVNIKYKIGSIVRYSTGFIVNKRNTMGINRCVLRVGNMCDVKWREHRNTLTVEIKKILSVRKINNLKHNMDIRLIDYKIYEPKYSMIGWIHPYQDRIDKIKELPKNKKIESLISKLGELIGASSYIKLSDELNEQIDMIIEFLYKKKLILLHGDNKKGFSFIGKDKEKHKKMYLDSFTNF